MTGEKMLMSIREYAKHSGIGESYLRRNILKMTGFPAVSIGRTVRVDWAKADEYISQNLAIQNDK